MDQPRTILMCEATVYLAFKRRWIRPYDLRGDEFLFYFVQDPRTVIRPPEFREVFDEAEQAKRLLYNCEVPSQQDSGHLETFLSEFGLGNELRSVIDIFEGAAAEFIDEYYARTPQFRVFGPYNPLSGFERRFEKGYAFVQR
jgi:hypothetical protein